MNNYFIFNGRSSNDFTGLIVQELPPITKPAMRIERTEIEGLDGDILDYQGYSAYDKTILIGLSRGYELPAIINWLKGSGKLILSNEPTKYYNAEIVEQIDFERLVTFKTAEIKIHVQPYKYLVDEVIQEVTDTTANTSLSVTNQGYIESKPIITIYGSGTVTLNINDISVATINIDDTYVTIDAIKQDCYKGSTLKNRYMTGDFEAIKLNAGTNKITWTGTVTKISVDAKSRWL